MDDVGRPFCGRAWMHSQGRPVIFRKGFKMSKNQLIGQNTRYRIDNFAHAKISLLFVAVLTITALMAARLEGTQEHRNTRTHVESSFCQSGVAASFTAAPAGLVSGIRVVEDDASTTKIPSDAMYFLESRIGRGPAPYGMNAGRTGDQLYKESAYEIANSYNSSENRSGRPDSSAAPEIISSDAELIHSLSSPSSCGRRIQTPAVFENRYPGEYSIIRTAADRNECIAEDFVILLAIRCAENGRAGLEFGVTHPRAINTDLNTQAGWAAATIVKNRNRWSGLEVTPAPGGVGSATVEASDGFIAFLADRYCPASVDPAGHRNWKRNVAYWYGKLARINTDLKKD